MPDAEAVAARLRNGAGLVLFLGPHVTNESLSALFGQVAAVLKAIARAHPLVLVLDDLQWADEYTLNLLFYLCRQLGSSRILLIGIYRLEELAGAARNESLSLRSLLNELGKDLGEVQLDLSNSDARAFVDALLDSQPNRLGAEFRAAFLELHPQAGIVRVRI